ncbi:MAG TPA: PTS mannitol transporter subunit IICBA [Candidatus Anaerostipes excrementavium]|uniref:Mannitol-specific phosphotransferase enzyme IIA component n=1 Tax=Candidatus Anaerostipes excrementavium TaxID=2838463 RepID=A0A9D1WVR8_9FIRM|nr:PTS mannitol transporter subunit IICBA [uncultured Anaerostipes sp.]HIX67941.1 PTS mannitol transporter subunit IICBA [Candidatus Anaerostipes excrementavium]
MKNAVQRFGKFLSAMVMPNIGAFIAWGLITALFIADGWIPNDKLASIQPYMLYFLLPALIAYTGGKMVGGDRGGVMGAIAVMGCIAGVGGLDGQPMLMGAMVMGPFAGWVIKKFDKFMETRMPAGFEMLINNFSVGILGMVVAIIGYYLIGPFMSAILAILTAGVNVLIKASLLPLAAIFIEPAKVLFLNNAINHGIFTPIAIEQAAEAGKSIMYMLEPNPGPGLGVLVAYWIFCKDKTTKDSAPGAIIIHLFGGIHEIYFPYVLMNPLVIVAPIAGNICAILWFTITGCGLVGPASPGSIITYLSMSPKSQILFTFIGVVIAAGVSFLVASPIIKMSNGKSLEEAQSDMAAAKAESKGTAVPVSNGEPKKAGEVKKIIFACDAGMGSSAMGATKFRNRIKAVRPDITVANTSVDNIPADCDIAVVQEILVERAVKAAPQAQMVTIGNFLADPKLDQLYDQVTSTEAAAPAQAEAAPAAETSSYDPSEKILVEEGIKVGLKSVPMNDAITAAGKLLNELGFVDEEYIPAMIRRNEEASVYMGMGIAIPHGTSDAKNRVKKSGIVILQYPDGVDFGGEKAELVIGIAGVGDEHLAILGRITEVLDDEKQLEMMKTTKNIDEIMNLFR